MLSKRLKIKKIMKKMRGERLFTVPPVLSELLRISRDPLADASDLATICSQDPTISARLLKMANSVYYGRNSRVETDNIADAIVRLGFRKSEEVIMSATVCAALVTNRSSSEFSMWSLWKHCYAVAISNRLIYTRIFDKSALDPFLSGLLHDIGIIIENQFLADEGFFEATEARQKNESLLTVEENKYIGVTHEEIGQAIAEEWKFPEHITGVIGHHHDMDIENPRIRHQIHCTRVSEWLCFVLKLGYCDFSQAHADELMQSRSYLKLRDSDLESLASELQDEISLLGKVGWFPYSQVQTA